MIQPTASFKDNLKLLPSIEGLAGINLIDASGTVVANIANEPGKQGSLAVYQYLQQNFGALNAEAATQWPRHFRRAHSGCEDPPWCASEY